MCSPVTMIGHIPSVENPCFPDLKHSEQIGQSLTFANFLGRPGSGVAGSFSFNTLLSLVMKGCSNASAAVILVLEVSSVNRFIKSYAV